MKFGNLKTLPYNMADSMVRGIGLLIGLYEMDVGAIGRGQVFMAGRRFRGGQKSSVTPS